MNISISLKRKVKNPQLESSLPGSEELLNVASRANWVASSVSVSPDQNKGIRLASGDIIGMLNADDFFPDDDILKTVASAFVKHNADVLYGDLDYINPKGAITRKWRSKDYKRGLFSWGWMPPHPTFYCKRKLFSTFGYYSLDYGTAADYELMLRFLHLHNVSSFYIKKVMIKMNIGGASNKSYSNRVKGLLFDLKAMRNNGIMLPIITLLLKPFRKIIQYF